MSMRRCRWRECGQVFVPLKAHYYFCSWECHQAHHAEAGRDARGWQRERNHAYDRGFWDGARARPPEIPPGIWKGLVLFSHPDKWQGQPGLVTLATEVTRWLLDHRPTEHERR